MSLVNVVKKPRKSWALVLYRDGANYKTMFNVEIPPQLRPKIKVDDEVTIQQFDIFPASMWDYVGNRYDEEIDHDLVDVVKMMEEPDENYGILESDILNEQLQNVTRKNIKVIKHRDGTWTKFTYDENNKKIREDNSDGRFWLYNENGNEIYSEQPDGFWWKKEYDNRGNEIYFENSDGWWDRWTYNEKNQFIRYENSNGAIRNRENTNESMEKKLNTGKLKLMEVLSPTDLKQIMTIASDEARKESKKVKDDLTKDVADLKKKDTDIKQVIDKHAQDKDHHLTKTDILKLAKDEDGKIDVDKKIDDKIEKALNGKEIDKKVREMFVDAMTDYHKTLWVKRGFWSGSLSK